MLKKFLRTLHVAIHQKTPLLLGFVIVLAIAIGSQNARGCCEKPEWIDREYVFGCIVTAASVGTLVLSLEAQKSAQQYDDCCAPLSTYECIMECNDDIGYKAGAAALATLTAGLNIVKKGCACRRVCNETEPSDPGCWERFKYYGTRYWQPVSMVAGVMGWMGDILKASDVGGDYASVGTAGIAIVLCDAIWSVSSPLVIKCATRIWDKIKCCGDDTTVKTPNASFGHTSSQF